MSLQSIIGATDRRRDGLGIRFISIYAMFKRVMVIPLAYGIGDGIAGHFGSAAVSEAAVYGKFVLQVDLPEKPGAAIVL